MRGARGPARRRKAGAARRRRLALGCSGGAAARHGGAPQGQAAAVRRPAGGLQGCRAGGALAGRGMVSVARRAQGAPGRCVRQGGAAHGGRADASAGTRGRAAGGHAGGDAGGGKGRLNFLYSYTNHASLDYLFLNAARRSLRSVSSGSRAGVSVSITTTGSGHRAS